MNLELNFAKFIKIYLFLAEESTKKNKDREDILRKLVNSQEVYIKELESKVNELESEVRFIQNNMGDGTGQRDGQKDVSKDHSQDVC